MPTLRQRYSPQMSWQGVQRPWKNSKRGLRSLDLTSPSFYQRAHVTAQGGGRYFILKSLSHSPGEPIRKQRLLCKSYQVPGAWDMLLAVSLLSAGGSGYCAVLPVQQAWVRVGYNVRIYWHLHRLAVLDTMQTVHGVVSRNDINL